MTCSPVVVTAEWVATAASPLRPGASGSMKVSSAAVSMAPKACVEPTRYRPVSTMSTVPVLHARVMLQLLSARLSARRSTKSPTRRTSIMVSEYGG